MTNVIMKCACVAQVGASRGVEQFMQHLPPSLQVLRLGVESGGYCLEIDFSDDEAGDFRKRWVACGMCWPYMQSVSDDMHIVLYMCPLPTRLLSGSLVHLQSSVHPIQS